MNRRTAGIGQRKQRQKPGRDGADASGRNHVAGERLPGEGIFDDDALGVEISATEGLGRYGVLNRLAERVLEPFECPIEERLVVAVVDVRQESGAAHADTVMFADLLR